MGSYWVRIGFVFWVAIRFQLPAISCKERSYGDLAVFEIGFVLHKKPTGQSPFGFKNTEDRI